MSTAMAYDHSGFKKVPVDIRVGDEVTYKKDGIAGAYRGRICQIRKRIQLELFSVDGRTFEPYKTWVKPNFLAVYRDGVRQP